MRLVGLGLGFVAAAAIALVSVHGCKSAESKGAAPASDPVATGGGKIPTGAPGGAAPAPGGAGAAASDKNDSSFQLAVEAPAPGKPGVEAVAHVVVTPGSGYHVNQEFPTRLVITPPDGVKVAKAELHKEDATKFDANKLQFDVKMTADKAGTYKVAGSLKFAVCTESSCDPKKREIAFDLAAQ
jgi:hypothetical protein